MRLEGFRACIDLVQHQCIGFLPWHEYFELQGAGLGCQAALGMSLKMLQVFIPLARHRLDRCHDCKFAHMPAPYDVVTGSRSRLVPIGAAEVFRRSVYSEHAFLEEPNSAIAGVLSLRFRRVFGTGSLRQRGVGLHAAHGQSCSFDKAPPCRPRMSVCRGRAEVTCPRPK
jgi:hypothetical protein